MGGRALLVLAELLITAGVATVIYAFLLPDDHWRRSSEPVWWPWPSGGGAVRLADEPAPEPR